LELDTKWILNLSMHFRDKSDREKFFVTFAERPNKWRRVTVSCDYRNAEPDSLETDLKELQYQRDKNAQIYESIRDSLPSIQFYNTVTNLKLETENSRLHVHVTEDVNEIIPYPPRMSVQHLLVDRGNPIKEARESQINFLSHLSGFVYKISFQGREYIKKEIPGPDTVDEFLYEVNALHALSASTSVIKLEAIVLDDSGQTVKGLLISYAERGALVDLLYDRKGELPWSDRMRWARQAVQGLSEIHEEGYVQGDFTLSNIVINSHNDAKIIDINRRGCPVGWEPPEIADKIASNQRISMYIGQKSDLYQLGMTLWALAMDEDEPERHDQPLSMAAVADEVPSWYKEIVNICLSPQPRDRLSAKELLRRFPPLPSGPTAHQISTVKAVTDERSPKKYIEPAAAVEREDLERLGRRRRRSTSEGPSTEDASFIDRPSSSYQCDSGSSFVGIRRGREPLEDADNPGSGHIASGEPENGVWDEKDLSPLIVSVSPGREPRYEGSDFGADPSLSHQASVLSEHSTILERDSSEQPPESDGRMTRVPPVASVNTVPETRRDREPQTHDADLELPNPHQSPPDAVTSVTSESTPRNAPSIIAGSATSIVPPPALDLVTADLAGLGGHPNLEKYSPHEPVKTPDTQSSQYYDTQVERQHSSNPTDVSAPATVTNPPNTNKSASDTVFAEIPGFTTLPEPTKPLAPPMAIAEETQPLQDHHDRVPEEKQPLPDQHDPVSEEKQPLPDQHDRVSEERQPLSVPS
jgi:serine/threonine protein kinase